MSRKATKVTKTSSETLKKEDVIQAVVIVDSFKGEFHPITDSIPLALIPVVNKPLLDYTLKCLSLSSVQEVFLFCCSHADLIKQHIKQNKWNDESSTMSVTVFVNETCRSLGDVMRDLDAKAIIRSDFILVSGNMIANLNLLPILQRHKEIQKTDKGAVMTMVYKEAGVGKKSRKLEHETILAVDSSSGRVLAHHKLKPRSESKLDIPLETYVDRPRVELRHNLQDTYVSICSAAVPPLFSDNFDFETRDDFVRGLLLNEEILASTIYWYMLNKSYYAAHVNNWQKYQAVSHDVIYRWIHPFVPDTPFSWEKEPYMFLRRNVYKQHSVTLGKGCILEEDTVVAEKTNIGEHTYISGSVIGENCSIGKNVIICNSYIWDNVVIGDGCNINNSVIAHKSELGENVILDIGNELKFNKGCIIGPDVLLPSDCKLEASIVVANHQLKKDVDRDEEYKFKKISDKAYILEITKSGDKSDEEDDGQQLHGFWLETSIIETDSESEDEISEGSVKSDRLSPVPEDTHLFFTEVVDSLTRGYEDKLHPDNLILEINSSRYAYNVSVREVNYFVNYVRNSEAQKDCLQALEDMATSVDILREGLIKLLHLLYEQEILTEDNIMEWYKHGDKSEMAINLRNQVAPFIRWLEEADEESDSE
ncbi:hypothetical protein L9F63_015229 [Diploptera punctata]|uniref:Translation initiation factor eIF2B subunit epsilon n=1 Tax=Diploptera punctata TaxID=6984 RepID=A0AAD8EJT3_DIPPU|nr:hypothetical protein L9F63_015229 [Diploptera punctata]